jgi:hypothetical protein
VPPLDDSKLQDPQARARGRRRFAFGALAIAVLGLALQARLGFASFPYDLYHDEPVLVRGALSVARSGDLHPPEPGWGTLPFYVLAASFRVAHSVADLPLDFDVDGHYAIARCAALLMTALAVCFTAHAGRLAFGEHNGLIAALALAIAPLTVEYAAQAVVDAWVLAPTAGALLAAAAIARGGARTRVYILGGASAGIAAACRITGGSAIVSVLFACWIARPPRGWRGLTLAVAGAALAFALANPYSLIDLPRFLGGLSSMSDRYSTAYIDAPTGTTRSWIPYGIVLVSNLGLVGTGALFFLLGLGFALHRNARMTLSLLASSAALFGVVGSFLLCIPRQVLPILPVACMVSALPASLALDKVVGDLRRANVYRAIDMLRLPLAWLGVVALLPTALLLCQQVAAVAATRLPDTRILLLDWLDHNVPDGSHVLREADTPRMDALAQRCTVDWVSSAVFRDGRARAVSADFIVINDAMRLKVKSLGAHLPREQTLYQELFERAQPLATFARADGETRGPTFFVFGALTPDLREHFAAP